MTIMPPHRQVENDEISQIDGGRGMDGWPREGGGVACESERGGKGFKTILWIVSLSTAASFDAWPLVPHARRTSPPPPRQPYESSDRLSHEGQRLISNSTFNRLQTRLLPNHVLDSYLIEQTLHILNFSCSFSWYFRTINKLLEVNRAYIFWIGPMRNKSLYRTVSVSNKFSELNRDKVY